MKFFLTGIMLFLLMGFAHANTTLFYDGFEANNLTTVWTVAGTGGYYRDITAPLAAGSYKFECSNKRYITNKKIISTVGYSNIRFNFSMTADSLEAGEYCQAQYSTDGGTTWIVAAEIRDPNDLNTFSAFSILLPSEAENIAKLMIRFRIYGNANNDYMKVDEVSVTGNSEAVDYPPAVEAGINQTIILPVAAVTLSGTATDTDNTPVATSIWTIKSSPSEATATIAAPNSLTTGVSGLTVSGNYVFRLTSTDTAGNSGYDEVTVTVLPQPENLGTILFYDGFEVNNLTTLWKIAGTGAYSRDITAPLCVGSYKFKCANKKYITNKTAISTVGYSNIRFIFYMAADSLEAGEYCQAQYSIDGGTVWTTAAEIRDPNDLNSFSAYNITLPPAAENIPKLMIRFRIYGNANNDYLKIDEVSVIGDPKAVDNPPTVEAGTNQTITLPTTTASLSGTATDTDSTPIATNIWTVKSSPSESAAAMAAPNALTTGVSGLTVSGNYVFRLTATDTAANSAYDEVTITVNPRPVNQAPAVNAGADKSITLPTTATTLTGTATDSDGTIASVLWTQTSGPKNTTLTGQDSTTLNISDLTLEGDYVFDFTATDNSGASSSDSVKITVFPVPPPTTEYPIFDTIPFAIGVAVDDLGWKIWTPENSRNPDNADYQTIMNVGQAVGTRIMTAWIMCDMDRSNILAKAEYNKPVATYNMSTIGTRWDNSWLVNPNDFVLMNLVKANDAYMEFGVHGVTHGHPNESNVEKNAEYALITNTLYTSTSWGWNDMEIRAKCFRDLVRQYFTVDEMAFPEAFVPPAHAYFYNNNDDQSTGALLSTFGVKYVNGSTYVATTLGQGGTDHGVVFMDRAEGANYNWENTETQNATPWYGGWNMFDYPKYPTDAYGWVESHFPNWWGYDVHNRWVTYLQGINNAPDRMLPRNTEACASQWFYRRNASVSGSEGTYSLTINSSMPDVAYTWNLLGALTIKTPLKGGHVSSASINNGAQVVGYYEDTFGYGYLIISNPSDSIGALAIGTYTLNATLGDTMMNTYVDMTLKTFNVYGFNTSSTQATISLKMYGTQDVKVKTLFTPATVSSDNPNLTVNNWNYADGFITINVSGRNMNGETGTLTIN
jgi:hypothetical protein